MRRIATVAFSTRLLPLAAALKSPLPPSAFCPPPMNRTGEFAALVASKDAQKSEPYKSAAKFALQGKTALAAVLLRNVAHNEKLLQQPAGLSAAAAAEVAAFVDAAMHRLDAIRRDSAAGRPAPLAEHIAAVCAFVERRLCALAHRFKRLEEAKVHRLFARIDAQAPRKRLSTPIVPFDAEADVSSAQLEVLRRHQTQMLTCYNRDLESVERAKDVLLEIGRMHATIQQHVDAQTEQIERIYDDAWQTTQHIVKGNEQLARASVHASDFRRFVLFFLLLAAASLLFLNWYA